MKPLAKENQSSRDYSWQLLQGGTLLLPLLPTWGAILIVLAAATTWRRNYRSIIQNSFNWGLALLSLWLIITCCFATYPQEAFLGLANFLPFFAVWIAFSLIITTQVRLRRLAWLLVLPSPIVICLGWGQIFAGWTTPVQLQVLLGWVLEAGGNPPGRMAAVFIYANILAAYLLITFTLVLGLWLDTYQRWQQKKQSVSKWCLPLLTIVLLSNGCALLLTSSRNAWGIALFALIAFAVYCGWRWLLYLIGATGASILWASFGSEPIRGWLRQLIPKSIWGRLNDDLYPDRPLATLRITQWKFTLNMTQEHSFMGSGLRNFTPLYEAKMGVWLGHPHNFYLMLMAETGIPGIVLLCGLIGWKLAQAVLQLHSWSSQNPSLGTVESQPLIFYTYLVTFGSMVVFNLFDVTLHDFRVNTLTWIVLSAICGVTTAAKTKN